MPLVDVPAPVAARLEELGGRPINLYRALANHPDLLAAWIEIAWAVRQKPEQPRALRELMIVRTAQLAECEYELVHHLALARRFGVSGEKLDRLPVWRSSDLFDERERAALDLAEAVVAGSVPDQVAGLALERFGVRGYLELAMTAALYCMVPRLLSALRVPLEA